MNRLLSLSLISFCLLILTGCPHKDKDDTNRFGSNHNPTTVIPNNAGNNIDPPIDSGDIVNCEATPVQINKFIRVQSTYGLLNEGAFISGETGGLLPIELTAQASQGDVIISVDSTTSLVDQQLLTYLGTNNRYGVGRIESITEKTITLEDELPFDLAVGSNSLWNFYDDAAHANTVGFKALADFGFNTAFDVLEPNKVHVLLGDSWFRRNEETAFADRLLERLPSGSVIKNEGIGGHSLCGLLARVDAVLNTHNPDYVWINSSINDSFDEVTQEQYKARMQSLIGKIQKPETPESGAIAIVMDPAPGILTESTSDNISFTTLSRRYAVQIQDLLSEAAE